MITMTLRGPRWHIVYPLAGRYLSIHGEWEDTPARSMLFMSIREAEKYVNENFFSDDKDFIQIEECNLT